MCSVHAQCACAVCMRSVHVYICMPIHGSKVTAAIARAFVLCSDAGVACGSISGDPGACRQTRSQTLTLTPTLALNRILTLTLTLTKL
jgi:hypothetical protein